MHGTERKNERKERTRKEESMKKYIGTRAFYKMVLLVAVPIMIQNGITNFVGMLDNIMVGQVVRIRCRVWQLLTR